MRRRNKGYDRRVNDTQTERPFDSKVRIDGPVVRVLGSHRCRANEMVNATRIVNLCVVSTKVTYNLRIGVVAQIINEILVRLCVS
jgi:hypothetical protein